MSETDYMKGKPKVHPLCYKNEGCAWMDDDGVICWDSLSSSHVCTGCKPRPEQAK